MSEHTIKYTVTPFVDFSKETLGLDITLPSGQIAKEVMNLKERAIREGLIALGWTPPGIADKMAEAILQAPYDELLAEALSFYENHKKPDQPAKKPCDCIEKCGKYWIQRCDCQNSTSLAEVQSWCDSENHKKGNTP
jgi:hypothetical protein